MIKKHSPMPVRNPPKAVAILSPSLRETSTVDRFLSFNLGFLTMKSKPAIIERLPYIDIIIGNVVSLVGETNKQIRLAIQRMISPRPMRNIPEVEAIFMPPYSTICFILPIL